MVHSRRAPAVPALAKGFSPTIGPLNFDSMMTVRILNNNADAVARSGGLSQALETKKCRTVEFAMRVFEEQAADWQAGQHQPDRVAAAVITHDRLAALAGSKMTIANPAKVAQGRAGAPRKPPQWMTRKIGKTA